MILTKFQKQAVQQLSGNVLVSAGAGTGKTRVLVERILHILRSQRSGIAGLLVLTFTDKAAHEIKSRLSRELHALGLDRMRRELEQAAIGTFHAFASRLLKEHPVEAGVDPEFRVLESEQSELMKDEALTDVIEQHFQTKSDAFELLRSYKEDPVRAGLLRVLTAARHEGKTLREFFDESHKQRAEILEKAGLEIPQEARAIMEKLGAAVDASGLETFFVSKDWDWRTLEKFRDWCAPYMRGGKRAVAAEWKRWRELVKDFAALKMEDMAGPWLSRFEALALDFESAYEASKREENSLDFDDLQIKAVRLFESELPALQKLTERYRQRFRFILVDEFQDTNFLQTRFIERLSSGDNMFVVGDYKQSIYGFRGAEPGIFFQKEQRYRNDQGGLRVPLLDNFRSAPELLGIVNRLFAELWREDGFPFEPLEPKADPDIKHKGRPPIEIHSTELAEDEEKDHARMREAMAVAARIRALHEKEGVPYGDMAVLFQAMTASGIYEHAMKTFKVPYFILAGRGFYHQPEIRDVVSFLTHLERPLLDIPLAAALRSPFFHITDDTLFWLSRKAKKDSEEAPLVRGLEGLDGIAGVGDGQKQVLRNFVDLTGELRRIKDRVSLAVLIDTILERTGYELAALAGPGGARGYANLKKLVALVREQESRERMPLSKFLALIERLRVQEVRESEAQITGEEDSDAVRMMTVHRAKGLEFPVVFVADLGLAGNRSGSKSVIAHASDGYAMRLVRGEGQKDEKPYFYSQIDRKMTLREDEEWKRLFYVACTRAKARLFFSGVYEKKKEPKELYRDMTSWMDWVMAMGEKLDLVVTRVPEKVGGFLAEKSEGKTERAEAALKELAIHIPAGPSAEGERVLRNFLRSIDLPVSAYVLFRNDPEAFWRTYQLGWPGTGDVEDPDVFPVREEYEGVPAAEFGTVMHSLLERVDFSDPEKYLEQNALERVFGGFGQTGVTEAASCLARFFGSDLFLALRRAKKIEREISFVLNGRYGLIHGKLDALFEDEKGAWHILDYKTAVGDEAAARESGYDLQIELYALAAHRVLGFPLRSGIIYYLKSGTKVVTAFPGEDEVAAYFDGIEKKVGALQQNILDFCNGRTG